MAQGEPAREPVPHTLAPEASARIDAAFDRAVAAYGLLSLDRARFRAAVLARALRVGAAEAGEVDRFVGRAALEDVCLATACDAGDERAWKALATAFRPRLEGVAIRRGVRGAEAQALVQDVLGDLARPPPAGGARTLLGTFDGSGSLFAWLSVGLVRRIAARARSRRVESLDAIDQDARDGAAPAARGRAAGAAPPEGAQTAETEGRFRAAFSAAWERLSGRRRLALAWKHRDGLTQRRIADLLGVAESRVSQLVSEAVETLASGVRDVLAREEESGDLWERLAAAVASRLGCVEPAPPAEERKGVER